MSQFIIDVNEHNFQQAVIDQSQQTLVLVDFWAPWCGPCKAVMPILEKLVQEYNGQFILAKINIDENDALANQFAIRSVPTFKLMKNGEVIAELTGGQPEAAFRQMLEQHMSRPSDQLRLEAQQAMIQGQAEQAEALLSQASQLDPNNFKIHLDLVDVYLQSRQFDKAVALFNQLGNDIKDSAEGKKIAHSLHFAAVAQQAQDMEKIKQQLVADAKNPQALYEFAAILMLHKEYEKALQTLLQLFVHQRDYQDGIAQKSLLLAFEMLAEQHPELVKTYRRKLQNFLY